MFARIARQYRRFLFASVIFTALVALGTLFGKVEIPEELFHPVIGPLSWLILLILVIGLPIAVLALIFPGLLPVVELWLLTFLVLVMVQPLLRSVDAPFWADCLVLLATFLVIERALYGPWLSHIARRDTAKKTGFLTLPGTPEDLWPKVCPTPGQISDYYWPGATILPAPEGSEADFILSLPRRGAAKDDLAAIHFEEKTYPTHARYRAEPLAGSPTPTIVIDIRLSKLDDGQSRLTYSQSFENVPMGQRLFFYLGHNFRDSLASLRARLTGRRDWSLQGAQMVKRRSSALSISSFDT